MPFPTNKGYQSLVLTRKGASINGISIKKQDTKEEASERRSGAHFEDSDATLATVYFNINVKLNKFRYLFNRFN